ncbi:hypothetical protein GH733_012037, partial [Mirounga leonina]
MINLHRNNLTDKQLEFSSPCFSFSNRIRNKCNWHTHSTRVIARLPPEGGSLGRGEAGPAWVPGLGRSAWPLGGLALRTRRQAAAGPRGRQAFPGRLLPPAATAGWSRGLGGRSSETRLVGAAPARRGGGKVRTRAAGLEGGGSCDAAQPSRQAGRARSRWRNLSSLPTSAFLRLSLGRVRRTEMESSLEASFSSSGAVSGASVFLPPARSRIFKIIVIGDSNVGKTCLTYRFCAGRFPDRTEATIGVDFRERAVEIDGERI